MSVKDGSSLFAAFMRNEESRSWQLLSSYQNVLQYQLMKYATEQKTALNNAAILCYVQPSNIAPQQYADELFAKLSEVTDILDKSIFNDVFMTLLKHPSPTTRLATRKPADLTDSRFRWNRCCEPKKVLKNVRSAIIETASWRCHAYVNSRIIARWSHAETRRRFQSVNRRTNDAHNPRKHLRNAHRISSTRRSSAQISESSVPSFSVLDCIRRYDASVHVSKWLLHTRNSLAMLGTIHIKISKMNKQTTTMTSQPLFSYWGSRFCNHRLGGSSSESQNPRKSQSEKRSILDVSRKSSSNGFLKDYLWHIIVSEKGLNWCDPVFFCYMKCRGSPIKWIGSGIGNDALMRISSLLEFRNRAERAK